MSRSFWLGAAAVTLLWAGAASEALAQARHLKTFCLWNSTYNDITYDVYWEGPGSQPSRYLLPAGSWFSHSIYLRQANDQGVPVYMRYKAYARLEDFTAWFNLEPQYTTDQRCVLLRNANLHYEFRGDMSNGGLWIEGPTARP